VDDFTPYTQFPENQEYDSEPVRSSAKSRDQSIQKQRKRILVAILAAVTIVLLIADVDTTRVFIAILSAFLIFSAGFAVLGALARPIPPTPPRGELRKVKLTYRCDICGSELKMTLANDKVPDSPRHCGEEMLLTTDKDDL